MIATALGWLLNPRVLIALAVVAALAAAYLKGRSDGAAPVRAQLEHERAAWQFERAKAAELAAEWERKARAQEEVNRNTERTWLEAARRIDADGQAQANALRAAAGRADAAVVGLHAQLGAVVAEAARSAEAAGGACDARQRAAAAETARVLADVLGECGSRYRAVAGFADTAAGAGERCERWGDALMAGQQERPP